MHPTYEEIRRQAIDADSGFSGRNYQDPTSQHYTFWRFLHHREERHSAEIPRFSAVPIPIKDVAHGLDISHWNGDLPAEFWSDAFASGLRFVFIKATEGISIVDSRFETNLARAKDAGFRVWGYHYARPQYSGAEQADFFIRVAGSDVLGGAWDLEEAGGVSDQAIQAASDLFLGVLNERYLHSWMYSAAWFLDRHPGVNPTVPYYRWAAHWNLYVTEPYLPAIWRKDGIWHAWQYWAQGTIGGKSPFDLNHMMKPVYDTFGAPGDCEFDREAMLALADRLSTMGESVTGAAEELRRIAEA